MKYIAKLLPILILLLIIVGCGSKDNADPSASEGPVIEAAEGYIIEISGERVLVLDKTNETDIGKTWNEIMKDYEGSAIWLKTSKVAELEIGQKVKYVVDGPVAESFPMQGTAKSIVVIE